MPFPHVLICCKVAIASGTLAGVLNTISQTLSRHRNPQKLLWDGSESLQAFAVGAALGTLGCVPYLVYKKGVTIAAAAETIGITVMIVSPTYVIACVPRTSLHVNRYLPVYLGGQILATTSALSLCSLLATLNAEHVGVVESIIGVEGVLVTVGLGTLSFLTFQFVNRLAVSELYFLYDSILPRDRNAPEVETFRGLIRFTQGWGNVTALSLLYTSLTGDYTSQVNLFLLDTSVADLTICNVLFLGLFHHMQAINATPEEKLLQRAAWVSFIPITFFSWGSLLLPVSIVGVFVASYQPYWREFDLLEQIRCRPVQPAVPAEPAPSAAAALPAIPAQAAQPVEFSPESPLTLLAPIEASDAAV